MDQQVTKVPEKRFHRSDSLLYEYTTVQMVEGEKIDYIFNRHIARIYAAPGVTWDDIFREVSGARMMKDVENPALMTVMTEYPEFVVALTLRGFVKIAESSPSYGTAEYDDLLRNLARELVAQRDYEEYVQHMKALNMKPVMKLNDFWPEDEIVAKGSAMQAEDISDRVFPLLHESALKALKARTVTALNDRDFTVRFLGIRAPALYAEETFQKLADKINDVCASFQVVGILANPMAVRLYFGPETADKEPMSVYVVYIAVTHEAGKMIDRLMKADRKFGFFKEGGVPE